MGRRAIGGFRAKRGRLVTGRRSGWRSWGAILAAYLLVLQAALTGLAVGAQASDAPFGGLGQILCSGDPVPADGAPDTAPRHAAPDCCVLGCQMLGVGMAPPPVAGLSQTPAFVLAAEPLPYRIAAAVAAPERGSGRPRGPPPTL